MKAFKKMIAVATAIAIVGLCSQNLEAQDYFIDGDYNGYEDCRCAPSLTPAVALATVALIAVIATTVRDGHGGHSHAH